LGIIAGGREGFSATLFYTTIYAFSLIGAFGVIALVRRETGGDDLQNFAGLRARSPLLAGCMAVFMLSLAGLPPLAGFFGKFYLFSAAFRAGANHGLLWLVALALFGSLISLYYYLIVLKVIFQTQGAETRSHSILAQNGLSRLTIVFAAAVVLFLGIAPHFLDRERQPGLDLLRALAIIVVVIYHAALFGFKLPGRVDRFGWIGVDLFFVLSGYLIGGQLLAPLARGRPIDLPRFFTRRALRILPAYLIILAVYAFLPSWREYPDMSPLWNFFVSVQNIGLHCGIAFYYS